MKSVAVFAVIVASSLALPLEDPQQWLGLKEFRQAPGYYGLPNYGAASLPSSGASASYGASGAAGSHGSAYGVFPNAKVGGCSVPLLLSCSPNVVHGKILPSYSAPSYRSADELLMQEMELMNHMREVNQHIPIGEQPQANVGFAPVAYHHKKPNMPSTPEKTTQD